MQTSPAVPGASRATSTGKSFYFGPALIASFLVGLLVSGCASAEKSTAGPDVLSFLQDGQTSREEIISHLGSPSRAIQNERFLFYRVGHDRGGYFVGELNHRRWADVRYSLVLVFDDAGVLKEHSMVSVRQAGNMRQSPKYERACDALRVVLAALACLACTGCIMVPIPSDRHTHDSRRAIPDNEIAALVPGETTLTQVLLRFGEPDYVYSDDSLIGYNWSKISSELWIFGEWFGNDDGFHRYKHGQEHNLDLTFDAQEKLLKHNLRHTPFDEHTK